MKEMKKRMRKSIENQPKNQEFKKKEKREKVFSEMETTQYTK
jgi:hypothetical protein